VTFRLPGSSRLWGFNVSGPEMNPHTPVPAASRVTTDEGDVQPGRRGFGVPPALIQLAYTPDAWAAMVRQPQNRLEALRPVVGKLGGTFEHAWLAVGEYDIAGGEHRRRRVLDRHRGRRAAKTFKTTRC
jgi:hypothetical protein